MSRKTRKNSGVGTGTLLAVLAGVGVAGTVAYLATRDRSSTTPTTPYGTGNATMAQRFDAGADEYMRTHPNI